jgi:glycerol transport system ATP-binding protein
MSRIVLDHIAHSYMARPRGAEDYALKPLDHVWDDGGAYALLGPSGCGKTTLLNIISGLITPSEGGVSFDGIDVTHLPTAERNIAQVFQFPVIYDTMTVAQNLAFPLRNRREPEVEVRKRVAEVAEMLELTPMLNQRARRLTADAKQKISLGRGLVRPDVSAILFDEPLTVIDPHLKWVLRAKIKQLHRQFGLTMVYVTHDQTEALSFADKVVVMYEGEVVQIGTPEDLFERPAHTFVGYFIGSPGMNVAPIEVRGDRARLGARDIPLGQAYPHLAAGAKIELGIRPEFVRLAAKGADGILGSVIRVDDVGRYRVVKLDIDGHLFNAIAAEDGAIDDDRARVVFDPDHLHVYADGRLVEGVPGARGAA